MANEYLKRTPTSSGNSRRWTLSFWMKNSDPTQGYTAIIGAGKLSPSNVYNEIFYNSSQIGLNLDNASASDNYNITANPLLRDSSSWMHVIVSFTDQGDNANTRLKFYINGAFTDHNTGTGLDVSETSFFNSVDYIHYIGSRAQQSAGTTTFDGQYFDVFLVDGQTLTPDVFGFYKDGDGYMSSGTANSTDFKPGQWSPHSPTKIKKDVNRRGGFGVNGFYLPMNDSSNPGADFHCTPNSIITLKGEDLPQPQNGAPTTSDAFVSQVRKEIGGLGFAGCIKVDNYSGLVVSDHSDLDLGTGDYTIEGFYYIDDSNVSSGYHALFDFRGTSGANGTYPAMFRHPNGHIYLYLDSAVRIDNVGIPTNEWIHVALSRSSGTTRLFVNGVEKGSFSDTISYLCRELKIGHSATQSNPMRGFISNFRVVKGTAVYTSNFTKPTKPLENITNTIVLLAQSATSAIAGVAPATIATYNYSGSHVFATTSELTGSISLAVPGIAGGLTNGYGDYSASIRGSGTNKAVQTKLGTGGVSEIPGYYGSAINAPDNNCGYAFSGADSAFICSGDFTVELWLDPVVATQPQSNPRILGQTNNSGGKWDIYIDSNTSTNRIYTMGGSVALTGGNGSSYGNFVPGQWNHFCLERSGSTMTTYMNGVAVYTQTYTNTIGTTDLLYLGSYGDPSAAPGYGITGKIQDFRFYKGVAKYKGGFDVPKPYTPVGIEAFRTVADTCKNNFATFNPVFGVGRQDQLTYSDGNLKVRSAATSGSDTTAVSTLAVKGKIYCEFALPSDAIGTYVGIMKYNTALTNNGVDTTNNSNCWVVRGDNGNKANGESGTGLSYGGAFSDGNIIMMAVDIDNSSIWWGRNGSWSASGNPSSNSNAAYTNLPSDEDLLTICGDNYSSKTPTIIANYGQNPTFGNRFALNKNRINSSTADSVWHQSSNTGNHTDWTVASGGTELDVAVPSGHYSRVSLRSADGTIDPKKTYLLSFKYTTGPANLGIQNDQGYMTAVDGSVSPNGLSSGNFYSFVVHGSSVISITGFNASTYSLDNVIVSEIDECYTDGSGKGKFHYQPPTGFLALCEDNLPTPAISDPGKHFKCVLYTGKGTNGSDGSQSIRKVGFQPDLVWVKKRGTAGDHKLIDVVRGSGQVLESNTTDVEGNESINFTGFNSDGFDLGANNAGAWNESPYGYVAWCWKAGGQAVTNSDGTLTSQVSVNQDAGFSIVKFTGQTSGTSTVGHGLGKKPAFWIYKPHTNTTGWYTYHQSLGASGWLQFDTTAATTGNAAAWGGVEPTSTVLTHGSGLINQGSCILYAWAEIEGYSRFGSYVGNGNADGTFVYCGFKPAWVLIKKTNGSGDENWRLFDSSRCPTNQNNKHLLPSSSNTESTESGMDFLSNGFKLRHADAHQNQSGSTYIFAAFAESSFQTANAK